MIRSRDSIYLFNENQRNKCTILILFLVTFVIGLIAIHPVLGQPTPNADEGGLFGFGKRLGEILGSATETLSSNITLGNTSSLYNTTNLLSPPLLAVSGDNIYLVTTEVNIGNFKTIHLWSSNDKGITFHKILNESDKVGPVDEAKLAAAGKNTYLTWIKEAPDGNKIMLKVSNNNGSSFKDAIEIGSISDNKLPALSAEGDYVYITWVNESRGKSHLLLRASTDGGVTFGKVRDILNSSSLIGGPSLMAVGEKAYLLWDEIIPGNDRVYFKTINGSGIDSNELVLITNKSRFTGEPVLRSANQNVFIAWKDGSNENLQTHFTISKDNGNSFNNLLNLGKGDSLESPLLSGTDKGIHVAWMTSYGNKSSLLLRSSTDGGNTFSNVKSITNLTRPFNMPIIGASELGLYAVWSNLSGIYLDRLSENISDVRTISSNFPLAPAMQTIDSKAYIAWNELNSATPYLTLKFRPINGE